ncbi:hypothetical protein [Nocardia sp. NPDC004711]
MSEPIRPELDASAQLATAEPDWATVELDKAWPELWKLRWKAARVSGETGLDLTVLDEIHVSHDGKTDDSVYGIQYADANGNPAWSLPHSSTSAWTFLNGIRFGVQESRRAERIDKEA